MGSETKLLHRKVRSTIIGVCKRKWARRKRQRLRDCSWLRELITDASIGGHARVLAARSVVELMTRTAVADSQNEQIAQIRAELAEMREAAGKEEKA